MSQNVIRIARFFGGTLGSPFFHDLNMPERLWTDAHLRVDRCTMNPEHVDPPAPECHCGMWAAVSQGALQRCLIAMNRSLCGHARFMGQVHESLTQEVLDKHRATVRDRAAIEQHQGDFARMRSRGDGWDWTDHALVGCRTLDPRSERVCRPELNYPGSKWDEVIAMRQLRLQCTRREALKNLVECDTPPDWRRYKHLQITHIWISDALADYAPDLRRRYNATVITAPDNDGGWLSPFMRTGHLPGLDAPTPAQRRAAMTPQQRLLNMIANADAQR